MSGLAILRLLLSPFVQNNPLASLPARRMRGGESASRWLLLARILPLAILFQSHFSVAHLQSGQSRIPSSRLFSSKGSSSSTRSAVADARSHARSRSRAEREDRSGASAERRAGVLLRLAMITAANAAQARTSLRDR